MMRNWAVLGGLAAVLTLGAMAADKAVDKEKAITPDAKIELFNGKEMNKATACAPSSGFIGIQCEGADIEVRKVTLEPVRK
ncbi:MAG: hypothetical protein NTX50_22705 [Candidatus Sumerlaeota bacterium]|nr:hypothetical protein [Candidatus Sumerlaeota bacterium]